MRRFGVALSLALVMALLALPGQASTREGDSVLRRGHAGAQVANWQHMLNAAISSSHRAPAPLVEDGIFGPATERATRWFERFDDGGPPPDGVVTTRDRISWLGAFLTGSGALKPLLYEGVRDPTVGHVQVAMNNWIERERLGLTPLLIDTIFGPRTEAAVRAWQASAGLAADGIVGPKTWEVLREGGLLALYPASNPVGRLRTSTIL